VPPQKLAKGVVHERPRSRFDVGEESNFQVNAQGFYVPGEQAGGPGEPVQIGETDRMSMMLHGDHIYFQAAPKAQPKAVYGLTLATKVANEVTRGRAMAGADFKGDVFEELPMSGRIIYRAVGAATPLRQFECRLDFVKWLALQDDQSMAAVKGVGNIRCGPISLDRLLKFARKDPSPKADAKAIKAAVEAAKEAAKDLEEEKQQSKTDVVYTKVAARYEQLKLERGLHTPGEEQQRKEGAPPVGSAAYYVAEMKGKHWDASSQSFVSEVVEAPWFTQKEAQKPADSGPSFVLSEDKKSVVAAPKAPAIAISKP
jgi:hypothetical protein